MNFPYLVNLCYIINQRDEVLLRYKLRGFGQGKWNAPGGKIEPEETILESVKREVREETNLIVKKLRKTGELEFVFRGHEQSNNYCHVFLCKDFIGEPIDNTGKGKLKWFKIKNLPWSSMWEDDQYWLPEVLRGKYIHQRFNFNKDGKLINYEKL